MFENRNSTAPLESALQNAKKTDGDYIELVVPGQKDVNGYYDMLPRFIEELLENGNKYPLRAIHINYDVMNGTWVFDELNKIFFPKPVEAPLEFHAEDEFGGEEVTVFRIASWDYEDLLFNQKIVTRITATNNQLSGPGEMDVPDEVSDAFAKWHKSIFDEVNLKLKRGF